MNFFFFAYILPQRTKSFTLAQTLRKFVPLCEETIKLLEDRQQTLWACHNSATEIALY